MVILKMCAKCMRSIVYPLRYCERCQKVADAEQAARLQEQKKRSNSVYNRTRRDKKYTQFYHSKDWKTLSASYMAKVGRRCEGGDCPRVAVEVHHIEPIQTPNGWKRRFDTTNLQALCVQCHNKAHSRF